MNEELNNALKFQLKGMTEAKMDIIIQKIEILVNNGFNPQELFPLGIPSSPDVMDKAVIKFIRKPGLEQDALINFVNNSNDLGELKDFRRIFTLGIVMDDLVKTEITLGGN
jgi:hypothetical protein